jgi:hypothetical protein
MFYTSPEKDTQNKFHIKRQGTKNFIFPGMGRMRREKGA